METRENPQSNSLLFEEKSTPFERLIMLADGIFAIAMTLLILDIKMPEGVNLNDPKVFSDQMGTLLVKSLFYLLTFITVAGYWMGHRRLMSYVKRQNGPFTWLTFLFLAFVVFFPVSFNILVTSGPFPQVVIFYALVLTGCGLCSFSLWAYASWKHRLIDPDVSRYEILSRAIGILVSPVCFCLSLLLLLIPGLGVYTVFYSWFLIPIIARVTRVIRDRGQRRLQLRVLTNQTLQRTEPSVISKE